VPYDILVLATGSDAILPRHTPGHDAKGVFVYRTIDDLVNLIDFAGTRKDSVGAVVGGGLLGLEAAKAMMDLESFAQVKLIERNKWVLSRQLDEDAGTMVVQQVRDLGLDVKLSKRVKSIKVDGDNSVSGVVFEDGEEMDCSTICFAIGVRARDDLALSGARRRHRRRRRPRHEPTGHLRHWRVRELAGPDVWPHRPGRGNGRRPRLQPDAGQASLAAGL